MASSSSPATLQNIYYERKVATARPCYICRRPTQTVLATIKTEDFLYACDGHLTDSGFATLISAPAPAPTGPSAEDIKKVISEYHSREAKKAEKAKGADGDKDKDKDKGKDKEKDNDKDKDAEKASGSPAKSPSPSIKSPASPPAGTTPSGTHRKYALHRQIWDMRRMEMRKKDHTAKAKEVGKGMPQVPRGAF